MWDSYFVFDNRLYVVAFKAILRITGGGEFVAGCLTVFLYPVPSLSCSVLLFVPSQICSLCLVKFLFIVAWVQLGTSDHLNSQVFYIAWVFPLLSVNF